MKAVILAGGKGTRLRPFTTVVPKPLLPLKERPILEHVILYLKQYGITDIIISIGYLGYQIKNYFGDGSQFGVHIEYVEEEKPLGTAGCLRPIKDRLTETFILMGGDNITNLNLSNFIAFHREKQGIISVALFEYSEPVPWGIYELNGDSSVKGFTEKPTFTHKAGTMIFCLEPQIFEHIPEQADPANLTDHVIPALLKSGVKVFGYPFRDYWIDIGKLDDYYEMNGRKRGSRVFKS